jgi:mRNA interferase HigB
MGDKRYKDLMRIIARRTLYEFWQRHADAEQSLRAWVYDVAKANWRTSHDIKAVHANASIINKDRVVFNIKGNDYRLIVAVSYTSQILSMKFIGTHAEYDNIDAGTIKYH